MAGLICSAMAAAAWYFYGASSEHRRRYMPNYLLQWEALRWALAQGCTVYDWWGAPTDPDAAEDAMQGVWQFKQGFGAELEPTSGPGTMSYRLPSTGFISKLCPPCSTGCAEGVAVASEPRFVGLRDSQDGAPSLPTHCGGHEQW